MIRMAVYVFTFGTLYALPAGASQIAFYTEDQMSAYSLEPYIVTQTSGASGVATVDFDARIPSGLNYFLPQFNSTLGTLDRVDIYFGIVSADPAENSLAVALDQNCGGCEKDLSVDLSFGFGVDFLGLDAPQSGPIRQFFEISEQSFLETGDFDNDGTTARPSAGEISLTHGSLDGKYSLLSYRDASAVSYFTGTGDVIFDVGAALSLSASLSCRDASLVQVSCNESLWLEIGGVEWALQVVYEYETPFNPDLTSNPPDPGVIYGSVGGFQVLPPDSSPNNLLFFDQTTPFEPEVVPAPLSGVLLLSGILAMTSIRRRA